jgi:hypothetical protein
MAIDREDIVETLEGARRTLGNLGYPDWHVAVWIADQFRAKAVELLPVVDESHALALFAGLFMGNSLAMLASGTDIVSPAYMRAVVATWDAVLPLLDGRSFVVPSTLDWDALLARALGEDDEA